MADISTPLPRSTALPMASAQPSKTTQLLLKGSAASFRGRRPGDHTLSREWILWYDERLIGKNQRPNHSTYGKQLRAVSWFDTVEHFWAVINAIKPPSELLECAECSGYFVMRNNTEPQWENPHNIGGGVWSVDVPIARAKEADQMFLSAVLALIGEQFETMDGDIVNGVAVHTRRNLVRLEMWLKKPPPHGNFVEAVGCEFKAFTGLPDGVKLRYFRNEDQLNCREGGRPKPWLTLPCEPALPTSTADDKNRRDQGCCS